jgi:hypothetical protein
VKVCRHRLGPATDTNNGSCFANAVAHMLALAIRLGCDSSDALHTNYERLRFDNFVSV